MSTDTSILRPDRRLAFVTYTWLAMGMSLVGTLAFMVLALQGNVPILGLGLLLGMYVLTSLGVEVGLHRYFSHRSFDAKPSLEVALAIVASMAVQGPVLFWSTIHRKHHRHADRPGDPHSPHLMGDDARGAVRGFWHAHVGWHFGFDGSLPPPPVEYYRYSRDLLQNRRVMAVDRYYPIWILLGLLLPASIGYAATRTAEGAVVGLIWGGLIRIAALHHVTWMVNSVGHTFGSRPSRTRDRSTNVWWLALASHGGGWHNNHHSAPGSARVGRTAWQIDSGYWCISILAHLGLVTRVRTGDDVSKAA